MYAVVEDCDTTRALMVSVVKSMIDEEVTGFGSAEGFVRELKVSSPDLSAIFLDINLPGISGLELIAGIKKYLITPMCPLLFAVQITIDKS